MTDEAGSDHVWRAPRSGGPVNTSPARLLLTAEHAVQIGARILRQGRSHIRALIDKGDRDFATDVDLQIEAEIKASLAEAAPGIPFLGDEALFADDQIALPVAGDSAVISLGPLGDVDHVRDPVAALGGLAARSAQRSPGPQALGQIATQRPAGLDI
jgi:Inositol monophosphatase family